MLSAKQEAQLPFIVHAGPDAPGDGKAVLQARTRKDAVEKAVGLVGQGLQNVTITDEDGTVYGPNDFRTFFEAGDD
jgi:hypothetical protein